jgi:hypothetical protein
MRMRGGSSWGGTKPQPKTGDAPAAGGFPAARPYGCNARCTVLAVASATAAAGAICWRYTLVVCSERCPRSCWIAFSDVPLWT